MTKTHGGKFSLKGLGSRFKSKFGRKGNKSPAPGKDKKKDESPEPIEAEQAFDSTRQAVQKPPPIEAASLQSTVMSSQEKGGVEKAAKVTEGSGSGSGEAAAEGSLSMIFNNIYTGIAVINMFLLVVIFILLIVSWIKFKTNTMKQKKNVEYNRIVIKDSFEYKLLSYVKESPRLFKYQKKGADPLLISVVLMLMTTVFYLCTAFILLIGIQYAISVFISAKKNLETGDSAKSVTLQDIKPRINWPVYAVIGSLVIVISMNMAFQMQYVNKVLKGDMQKLSDGVYALKKSIFGDNLYVEKNLIDALNNDNFETVKELVRQKITTDPKVTSRMVFTYNVHRHYVKNFTASSPQMKEFKDRFDVDSLRQKPGSDPFEPVEFLVYDDNLNALTFKDYFRENLDAEIEATGDSNSAELKDLYQNTKIGDTGVTIQINVKNRLNRVNEASKIFTKEQLNKAVKPMNGFLLGMFIVALVILAVGIFVILAVLKSKNAATYEMLISFFSNIVEKLQSLGLKFLGIFGIGAKKAALPA